MKKLFPYLILFSFLILNSGCRLFSDIGYNFFLNFKSPEKVNKINNPIRDSVSLSALWIGHASVLIQIYDKVIITDPFLTDNVGEIQRRLFEPGIDIDKLKKLDLILLSHSHFDHTNLGSLGLIEDYFPNCAILFPEGLEDYLPNFDFNFFPIKKADDKNGIFIGETLNINGISVTAVAAFHWGGRYGLDGKIWGYDTYTGYIIQYKDKTVYFSGDTGYDEKFFKYLGNHFNIDVEFIPIGPCRTCDELQKEYIHVYPKGALKILDDTKAKCFVPIHYGTIYEKSDPELPKLVLMDEMAKLPKLAEKVKILKIGEQIIF